MGKIRSEKHATHHLRLHERFSPPSQCLLVCYHTLRWCSSDNLLHLFCLSSWFPKKRWSCWRRVGHNASCYRFHLFWWMSPTSGYWCRSSRCETKFPECLLCPVKSWFSQRGTRSPLQWRDWPMDQCESVRSWPLSWCRWWEKVKENSITAQPVKGNMLDCPCDTSGFIQRNL